jgi:hypothetical protein
MPAENETGATGASLTQIELGQIVGHLNTLALSLTTAAKAVESVRTLLDALRNRLPPGPGSPSSGNPGANVGHG